jgi:hypothetical protein
MDTPFELIWGIKYPNFNQVAFVSINGLEDLDLSHGVNRALLDGPVQLGLTRFHVLCIISGCRPGA